MAASTLSQTRRYAAGALLALALALRQAKIRQSVLLSSHGLDAEPDPDPTASLADPVACNLWAHDSRGLLRPILRFLEIDPKAWPGMEKTVAATSESKHHIGDFLRKVFEDENDDEKTSMERSNQELALAKAIDAMAMGLESNVGADKVIKQEISGGSEDPTIRDDGSRCWE